MKSIKLYYTEKTCPGKDEMNQERKFFKMLSSVVSYKIKGTRLTLTSRNGNSLVFGPKK